jgi:serine/threonine protein kinase
VIALNEEHLRRIIRDYVRYYGIVWRAQDERLDRQVAVKILPESFADDPERRSRFAREAKAVAALNHPNIVTVFSVEEAGRTLFIVMELLATHIFSEWIVA